MKMNKMLHIAVCMAIVAGSALASSAKINTKYHEKIAKKVWAMDEPAFDAKTVIADSLNSANSAVIIAWLDNIDIKKEAYTAVYKASGETNRIVREHLKRVLVRLNDQSAVDHYSEFEFDDDSQIKQLIVLYRENVAFGARVHKHDGSIANIDVSNALEISDGKKSDKNTRFRLAIPGLEPGDVLEYFHYNEEMVEEFDLDHLDLQMCTRYPVLHREIRGLFSPYITIEAKSFNGVPNLKTTPGKNENNELSLVLTNMPAITFEKYTIADRQLPFVRMNFLNNTSSRYHPATARRGGFYGTIAPGTYYRDIFSYFHDAVYESMLPDAAAKLVRNYFLKNTPDATPGQTAEAAHLALQYAALTDDREKHDRSSLQTMLLLDTFDKLKVAPRDSMGFVFFNSYDNVPTEQLTTWEEPRFAATVAGRYFDPLDMATPSGEMGARYQGQQGGCFIGNAKNMPERSLPTVVQLPDLKHTGNRIIEASKVSVSDDGRIVVDRTMTRTGMAKENVKSLTDNNEWIDAFEDYFNIPASKRYKAKDRDNVGRNRELIELLKNESEAYVGLRPDTITDYKMIERGIMPGQKAMNYCLKATYNDLVQNTGDMMVVNIGKLFGAVSKLDNAERNRILDAMLPSAFQESRTISFAVPDGYTVDEESLGALNVVVNNLLGTYAVQPRLSEDGRTIDFTGVSRIKTSFVSLDLWPKMVELLDAATDFSEARLILNRM